MIKDELFEKSEIPFANLDVPVAFTMRLQSHTASVVAAVALNAL